jgi:hypothetical protein
MNENNQNALVFIIAVGFSQRITNKNLYGFSQNQEFNTLFSSSEQLW